MPRYGDLDKLSEQITTNHCGACGIYNGELCCSCPMNDALRYIDEFPTADVAPRAEVTREIFEAIEREITDALKSNYKVLPQVEESEALWNNVNGKINALRGIEYFITELKKKYTGATDTNDGHKTGE